MRLLSRSYKVNGQLEVKFLNCCDLTQWYITFSNDWTYFQCHRRSKDNLRSDFQKCPILVFTFTEMIPDNFLNSLIMQFFELYHELLCLWYCGFNPPPSQRLKIFWAPFFASDPLTSVGCFWMVPYWTKWKQLEVLLQVLLMHVSEVTEVICSHEHYLWVFKHICIHICTKLIWW